jgi:hypothetical protein
MFSGVPAELDHLIVAVEKAVAILLAGHGAYFGAAEEAVAVAGYDVVSRIAQERRHKLHKKCEQRPRARELFQDEEDSIGAGEQMFVGEFVVEDDVNCVEITGAGGVAGEDGCGESALQRGETEDGVAVTAENELDEAAAESADAVVEKDGVGHRRVGIYFVPEAGGCGPA